MVGGRPGKRSDSVLGHHIAGAGDENAPGNARARAGRTGDGWPVFRLTFALQRLSNVRSLLGKTDAIREARALLAEQFGKFTLNRGLKDPPGLTIHKK
jgi:hypothetical protein